MFSKRAARVSCGIASVLLEEGEIVEVAVQGKFGGEDAVALATDRRVLVVNDRQWEPDVVSFAYRPGLTVQGWQDDRTASLVFQGNGQTATIEQIAERELAQRFAMSVRGRVG